MRGTLVFDAKQYWWKRKLLIISSLLLLLSGFGLGSIYGPLAWAEGRYWLVSRWGGPARLASESVAGGFGRLVAQKLEGEVGVAPDAWFSIVIPKIQARSKVIANVDAGNKQEYLRALKTGVAHAAGTGFPGEKNEINRSVVLFAHSTDAPWNFARYNAVFYLLNKLEKGDKIEVYFQGVKHEYRVEELRVVSAQDVSYYEKQTKEEVLILQTCYPPGTTLKRLLVIAKPI